MALNPFGQKVMELCARRGINLNGAQRELAEKLEDAGYGRMVKHVKNHVNRAFQRDNQSAIKATLVATIIEVLDLNEAEVRELYEAFDETGRQALQDIQDTRSRTSIQSGYKAYAGFLPFYA